MFAYCAPACAEWVLSQASAHAVGGQALELNLYIANDTQAPMAAVLPERLPVQLILRGGPQNAEIRAVTKAPPNPALLAPGEFRRFVYRLVLPDEVDGPIAIELVGVPAARLIVLAERPASVAATPQAPIAPASPGATSAASGASVASAASTAEVTERLRATDTIAPPALQTNEPMYFVVGRESGDTTGRFQLSFKYRLFDEKSMLSSYWPGAAKLYFGYTQTSLWDFSERSSPFRDTSYRPSLFYFDPQIWASTDGANSLGMAGGLEHESNGRSGTDSRSINIAFIQPTWRKFLDSNWYVSVSPKVWTYLDKEDNDDIQEYRGYANLNLRLGRVDGWLFSADLRHGTKHFGSMQLDASYPIRQPFFANAGGYLHFQYFNGYGESLLDYDRKGPAQFRVGFSIVR